MIVYKFKENEKVSILQINWKHYLYIEAGRCNNLLSLHKDAGARSDSMEFKAVIGTKNGKSVQRIIPEQDTKVFLDKKIGDIIKGESINLSGWEFKITGGSDKSGLPMRSDVPGVAKKRILAIKGVGVNNKKKYRGKDMKGKRTMNGMRTRKSVAGNTISRNTTQINMKAIKEGSAPLPIAESGEKKE